MASVFGRRSAEQRTAAVRSRWWANMSGLVEIVTGRPLRDDTRAFQGVSPAGDRSAICDALVNAYAGDLRDDRFVTGLARHLAVRDVDNLIAASRVPQDYRAILNERGRVLESAVPRDRLDEAAVDAFVAEVGDHLRDPDIARKLLPLPHQPGQQSSPMRAAARALFMDSAEARARIPAEQHENAITGIQQAMETHYRLVDGAANGRVGHSGLSPRALEQTLLEARLLGGEVAGIGIEAVEKLAHPPAPAADQLQAAFIDASAAKRAATSGVTPATGTPITTTVPTTPATPAAVHRDPREAYRYDPPGRS